MALPPPAQDQQTIQSFKRTLNAAVLLAVTARASRPPTRRLTGVAAALSGAGALILSLHAPGWFTSLR